MPISYYQNQLVPQEQTSVKLEIKIFFLGNVFENAVCKITAILLSVHCVNDSLLSDWASDWLSGLQVMASLSFMGLVLAALFVNGYAFVPRLEHNIATIFVAMCVGFASGNNNMLTRWALGGGVVVLK